MKTLITLILLFLSFTSFSQSNIDQLKAKKDFYNKQIKSFTDSLKLIDVKIANEENLQLKSKLQQTGFTAIDTKVKGGNSSLYKGENPGESICSLNMYEKIKIIGVGNNADYYKVEYKGKFGYMMRDDVEETPQLKTQRDILAKSFDEEQKAKREQAFQKDKQALLDKYGAYYVGLINTHTIAIGMSDDLVRLSIGSPEKVNRTETTNSVDEQWVYPDNAKYKYLYFENGILRTIQN